MNNVFKSVLIVMLIATFALFAVGCGSDGTEDLTGAQSTADTNAEATGFLPVKVGTLATDDLLPLWVAQAEGFLSDAGLDVEIITFQSPMESRAAMTAGEIDALMTDMVVATQLTATEGARAVTTMQTAPAGILASPGSGITELSQLKGVPIGCSSPTILEFIVDRALTDVGFDADEIVFESIEKLPVRLEMLMSDQVKAASLPWTLFQLAEQQGAIPLLDQAAASGYSSTVLVFRDGFLTKDGADQTVTALLKAWDEGVASINENPDSYRELLIEVANLPEPLQASYMIRTYPLSATPSQSQFEEVVNWMVDKGYLEKSVDFADLVY
ncbi:MAG: ABC transporter substrate-binding protein [Coriobacteriia bacterium]|nr:ABC transporter substrate-binding protein [Coriobacteriia bacterium]